MMGTMAARTPLTSKVVVEMALELGASLAGVSGVAHLPLSEPHSLLVLALAHGPHEPELDYWGVPGGTRGNQLLIRLSRALIDRLEQVHAVRARDLPYRADQGGIYLKDAAVPAGLGCIGKNNLLLTPAFGPLVRLRALLIEAPLEPTGPSAFDPCTGCPAPCRSACPRHAFEPIVGPGMQPEGDAASGIGVPRVPSGALPARDGSYSRERCGRQMSADRTAALGEDSSTTLAPARGTAPRSSDKLVRYCRLCELSCVLVR
jgi:epoxyqueuosine reductase